MSEQTKQAKYQHLALNLYSPIYAERNTIKEAYAYASEIAKASGNPAATMTAIHVLLNTVAKEIERIGTERLGEEA